MWRPATADFDVPYVVAWIDMDDGWQLLGGVVGCEPSKVAVDMRVRATFAEVAPGSWLPFFTPEVEA